MPVQVASVLCVVFLGWKKRLRQEAPKWQPGLVQYVCSVLSKISFVPSFFPFFPPRFCFLEVRFPVCSSSCLELAL